MKRKNLKLVTALLVVFSMLLTGGMFAYWATGVLGDEKSVATTITIGAGEEHTTTLNLNEFSKTQGVLVPEGYEKEGSISSVLVTYKVKLLADQNGANGSVATLSVTVGTLPDALLVVSVNPQSTTIVAGGTEVSVVVTVKITEPETIEEYNRVANKQFSIPLTFSATI